MISTTAHAAILTWDASGTATTTTTATDGTGTWDTTTSHWNNNVSDQIWNNSAGDTAVIGNNNGLAGTLTLAAPITVGGLIFNAPGIGSYNLSGSTLTLSGSRTITTNAGASISSTLEGLAGLIKAGSGTLTLSSAANIYTGGTTISRGTLVFGANGSLGAGTITLGDATTGPNNVALLANFGNFFSGRILNNIIVSHLATGIVSIGTTVFNIGSNGTIFEGALTLNRDVSLAPGNSDRTTFDGQITGTGNITIPSTSSGGRISFGNNSNNFLGNITIDQDAFLQISADGAIPNTTSLTVNGRLGFNAGNPTIDGLNGASTGTINLFGIGSSTLTVGAANGSGDFAGAVGPGLLSFIKSGTGTQTLSGINTYTGTTTLNSGVLSVSNLGNGGIASNIGQSSNAAANLVFNGGSLRYTGAGHSTDRLFTLNAAGGTIDASGIGVINFTSAGAVDLSAQPGARTLTLAGSNTGSNTLASFLGDGGAPSSLIKAGPGTWVLAGTNTYTGTTTVGAGILRAGVGGQAFGSQSAVTLSNVADAALDLNNFNQAIGSLAGGGVNGGNVSLGIATLSTGGNNTSTSYAGVISGTGGLTKLGSGIQTLTGNNTYSGTTLITAGALQLGSGGTAGAIGGNVTDNSVLIFNRSDAYTFAGTISGNGSVAQLGSGSTTLTANSTYTGGTSVSAGTLQLGNGGTTGSILGDVADNATLAFNRSDASSLTGIISGTGSVAQIGTGQTTLTGTNTYTGSTNVAAGALYVNGDQSAATGLTSVAAGATLGGTGTLGGSVSVADGATLSPGVPGTVPGQLNINGNLGLTAGSILNYRFGQAGTVGGPLNDLTTVAGDLTLDGTLNVTTTAGGSFAPGIYRVISYGGALTNNGLALGAPPLPSTLSVQTAVANQVNLVNTTGLTLNYWDGAAGPKNNAVINGGDGVWQSVGSSDNWTEATGAINAPFSDNSFAIFMGQTGTVTVDNSLGQVTAAGMQFASDGYVLSGGSIALNGSPTSIIRVGDGTASGAGYTATINSALTGASSLEKDDLGTLLLTGANTYTGGTAINGGVLQITNDGNLGAAAGTLSLDGGTLRTTADVAMARDTTLGASGGTFDTQAGTLAHSGIIVGAGALTKTGAGTLTLTAAETYTGGTTVAAGTLQLGDGGTSGSLVGDVTDNATLAFNRSDVTTFSGIISGTGSVAQVGSGTTALTGSNTYSGGTTISAGTLQLGDGGTSGSLLGDVTDNSTLAFNRSDVASFGGGISGTGSVAQIGSGTTALTGSNTYSGGTTVAAGTLQLGDGGTSGSILGDVTDNATLAFNRSDATTFSGVISGTGSVVQIGSGQTTLTGINTYSGLTNVEAGSLFVNGDQSAATGLTSVVSGANLGGTGTLGGNVSVADGASISPGVPGTAPGQLNINGELGLSAASILNYRFGQAGVVGGPLNDLSAVAGHLTLDGTLNVATPSAGAFTPGIYRIVSYGGTLTDNGLVLSTTPSATTLAVQTAVANQVNLVNTTGLTLNYWDGAAGPKNNGVINGGDGIWQSAGNNDNWTDITGAINASFSNSSFTEFMAQPGTITVDNSLGQVTVAGMQFASDGYVLSGGTIALSGSPISIIRVGDGTASGAGYTATINSVLEGASSLEKEDLGTLVLTGANTYTGGTAINGGALQIASDSNLGAAAGTLSLDGGTLRTTADVTMARDTTLGVSGGTFDMQAGTLAHSGIIAGAGALTKTGAGTLSLSGANTYTGGTALKSGQITLGNNRALGDGALSMDEGTTLGFSVGGLNVANAIVLTGTSDPIVNTGVLVETLSGAISGNGALTKEGSGTLILSAPNTYSGPTTVAAGTLQAGAANTFSAASTHSVSPGATLDTAGFHQDLAALQNAGIVSLLGASPGNTLRVTGAYVGQEGVLKLGTGLSSGTTSVSDRLILDGPGASASGHTFIQIANLKGLGAATTGNGVEIVSGLGGATTTAQTTKSAFTLANGHVDAGAFEYRLYAADSQGAGENWYLRATTPVPPTPEQPTPPGVPTYRSEVPLLSALPTQMQQADLAMLGTYRQRIGDDFGTSVTTSSGSAAAPRQSWVRVVSSNLDIEKSGIARPHADTSMTGVQAGTDLIAVDNWHAGVYVGYLKGSADVSGNAHGTTGNVGRNDLDSNYLGAYATWMDASGLYVDSVLQGGRHDYTVHPDINPNVSGDAYSVAVSVEVGKPFALEGPWSIEPQAQLIYQNTNTDDVNISGAKVRTDGNNGWVGRLGVRLKGDMISSAGRLIPYTQVNFNHASFSDSKASFIGPAGKTSLKSPNGYDTAELAVGSTLALSPSTSLYGEFGHQWSLGGDTTISSNVQGSFGVRINW